MSAPTTASTTNMKATAAAKSKKVDDDEDVPSQTAAAATTIDTLTKEVTDGTIPSTAESDVVEVAPPLLVKVRDDDVDQHPIQLLQQEQQPESVVVVDNDIDIHFMKIAIELAQLE